MAGYVIIDGEVIDEAAFAEYAEKIVEVIAEAGGKYLVRGGGVNVIDGDWSPQRLVIIEFDSVEQAQGWIDSPGYQEIHELRDRGIRSNLLIVQGV